MHHTSHITGHCELISISVADDETLSDTNVPAGYVYVKPALFIDNEKVGECEVAEFNLGAATTMEIDLSFVGNVPEKSKNISNNSFIDIMKV